MDPAQPPPPPKIPSTRFCLAVVMFFGCLFSYAMRTNLSMAVICMVAPNTTAQESGGGGNCAPSFTQQITDKNTDEYEFDWSEEVVGNVLGSFFYGYILSQVLGGYLAGRFGGKRVILTTILGSSVLTLANPVAARTSPFVLMLLRAMIGFLQGATFPAMHTVWSIWGPPAELSFLTGVTYAGAQLGNVIVLPLSGFLCENVGWPSVFYVIGIAGMFWCIAWMYFVSDRPSTHKKISQREKEYIIKAVEASIGKHTDKPRATPWLKLVTSLPVWACWVGHSAGDWGAYTMALSMPRFLKDLLGLEMSSLGFLASIPYIAYFLVMNVAGYLADKIREKGILSTLNTRRAAMLIALIGQAVFLILASFGTCGQELLVIICITIGMGLSGLQYSGFVVNYLEIAPPFSGTAMGIGNTISSLMGLLTPVVTAKLTKDHTAAEWQLVMYVMAGILTFGAVFFAIFADGKPQSWAKNEDPVEQEMAPLKDKGHLEEAMESRA